MVQTNVKFASAQQEQQIHQYKNIKEKKYETNAAIWYNKTCRHKQLVPNYVSVMENSNNRQCLKMIKAATHHHLNQELNLYFM
jgi:hypothetical protein